MKRVIIIPLCSGLKREDYITNKNVSKQSIYESLYTDAVRLGISYEQAVPFLDVDIRVLDVVVR